MENNKLHIKKNLELTYFEKSKKGQLGEIRVWGGVKYQKQQDGSWNKMGEKTNSDSITKDTKVGVTKTGLGGKIARTGIIVKTEGKTHHVMMNDTDDIETFSHDELFNNEDYDD